MIAVRPAEPRDAVAMSDVLAGSIRELCGLDHQNDPAKLAAWLANKSPDGVRAMLADPARRYFVAEQQGAIAGVGAIEPAARVVALNYVAPTHASWA